MGMADRTIARVEKLGQEKGKLYASLALFCMSSRLLLSANFEGNEKGRQAFAQTHSKLIVSVVVDKWGKEAAEEKLHEIMADAEAMVEIALEEVIPLVEKDLQ